MPQASEDEINKYGQYLLSQGKSQQEVSAYVDYLHKHHGTDEDSWKDTLKEHAQGLLKGTLKALPVAGALTGAAVGSVLGPVGSLGGAGLGAAAGKSLQNAGETMMGEGPKSREEAASGIAKEAQMGVIGEGVGQALPAIGKVIQAAGQKVAAKAANVPEQVISTYLQRAEQVKQLAAQSGRDTAEAADAMRGEFGAAIDKSRSELNQGLKTALNGNTDRIDPTPIIDSLKQSKANLHGDIHGKEIGQIDDMIDTLGKLKDENGQIFAKDANQLKAKWQDLASAAYRNPGESTMGTEAAKAAKSAAAILRGSVNKAVPGIAKANETLAAFHQIEDEMNRALITQRTPENALVAAGKGGNAKNLKDLRDLSSLTGVDMVSKAQDLAAMKHLEIPSLLSREGSTGAIVKAAGKLGDVLPSTDLSTIAGKSALGQSGVRGTQGLNTVLRGDQEPQ